MSYEYTDKSERKLTLTQSRTGREYVLLSLEWSDAEGIFHIPTADGSLLDSTNLQLIEEMAVTNDYQVWIEMVNETGDFGIVIEDGEVA